MRIKLLKNYDEYTKGQVLPVEDSVAKQYIAWGIAEQVPDPSPMDDFEDRLAAGLTKGLAPLFNAKANGGFNPATAKVDAGQSPEDKRKSFAEHLRLITVAQCTHLFPGQQQTANETLEKVYGSTCNAALTGGRQKAMGEDSGTTGGYTVAPLYGQELFALAAEQSIVRPYANVKQLPAREAYYPMLNQTFVPSGTQDSPQSAIFGNVQVTWLGENQPGTTTQPNFKQIHVVTNELQSLTGISRFLLNDSFIAMDAELRSLFSGAIAWAEDYAFLIGNGVDKPLGVINAPATITYATRKAANSFELADAANMAGAMMPQSRMKSVWVMTNTAFPQLIQLVDGTGRVTFINNVGSGYGDVDLMKGQVGLQLMGRPVLFTEKLPALGTTGDVLLADFSKYIVADTGTLEIAASDQYAFNLNQITYRVIKRVDGQPQLDAAYVLPDGTTKNSPFIILNSATS